MMRNKLISYKLGIFCLICIGFLGCGKSNTNGSGNDEVYFECKLNGKLHKFNFHTNANDKPPTDKVQFVVIGGNETEDILSPSFGIDMLIPESVKEQTYQVAGGSAPELDGQYCIQLFDGKKHTGTYCYMGGRNDKSNFKLTITSLTKWGVKGTFSGLLSSYDDKTFITVTEGRFSAPYN